MRAPAGSGTVPTVRRLLLAALGLLLLQLSWALSIPAFGGMDEFDHAYRASAVAHGQWIAAAQDATRGTGAWVLADPSLPRAARAECQIRPYTSPADCIGTPQGDLTRVASGAGRYNPLFYALVGFPTLPFSGTTLLFALRTVAALWCTLFIFLGLVAMRRWARTTWPFLGALLVLTPTVSYSLTMAAPNGLEIAAGFAFWSAFVGLLSAPAPGADRPLLALSALSAVVLVLTRSMGPLWCVLAAAIVLLAVPGAPGRLGQLLRDRIALAAAFIVAAAAAAAVWWTRSMGSLAIGAAPHPRMSVAANLSDVAGQSLLWLFQSVGAFPYREDSAPLGVYASYFVLGVLLVMVGWRHGGPRQRLALFLVIVLSALIPGSIAYSTATTYYHSWQGRYALPFSLGLLIIAGLSADREVPPTLGARWIVPGTLAYAFALVLSVTGVLDLERRTSPSASDGAWSVPPDWLIVCLVLAGSILLWQMVRPAPSSEPPGGPRRRSPVS